MEIERVGKIVAILSAVGMSIGAAMMLTGFAIDLLNVSVRIPYHGENAVCSGFDL